MSRFLALLLAGIVALAALAPVTAQVPQGTPAPASLYAQPPFLERALLSPDGALVAAQLSVAETSAAPHCSSMTKSTSSR